jgi:hypothetical protein
VNLVASFNALQARIGDSATLRPIFDWVEWQEHKEQVSKHVQSLKLNRHPYGLDYSNHPTLADVLKSRTLTIDEVKSKVAERLGVPIEGMHAKGNRFPLPVLARRLAIYICRQRTQATADELAKAFGYCNHSSAFEAMGKIETLRGKDARIDALLEELSQC